MSKNMAFFVLSVDVEFAWGFIEEIMTNKVKLIYPYLYLLPKSRESIRYLLQLLDKHEIPATWAITGSLLIDLYQSRVVTYLSKLYPNLGVLNPTRYERLKLLWYAPDVVNQIMGSRILHEIASHSFTHPDFWKIPSKIAEIEVRESKKILREVCGVEPLTFIFPKNHVNYLGILSKYGFQVFRSKAKDSKAHSMIKVLQYFKPTNVVATPKVEKGLWRIPCSLLFQPASKIHLYRLYRDVVYNINYIARKGGVFHIILHDYSLVSYETKKFFSKIIDIVARLCMKEKLLCVTMRDLVNFMKNTCASDN